MEKTLIIAFDGLDKELIERYDLETIKQDEFGLIDNQTNISSIKTSELFASFITGKTCEEHGVKGIAKSEKLWKRAFWEIPTPQALVDKVRGFHRLRKILQDAVNTPQELRENNNVRYRKEDLQCDTIFEEINDSEALFVPSYNPSWAWMNVLASPFSMGGGKNDAEDFCDMDHMWRKEKLEEKLSYDYPYELLMCHFHKSDLYQHLYGNPNRNQKKLEQMYSEIEELAEEIKQKAKETGYERIIFMSDHGLPLEKGHNQNAFYSCNKELFPSDKPHITDFYNKIKFGDSQS